MDDFEKKDLQSPENEADGFENRPDEDAKSPTQVEDDLVKELEGIRDLLQNELDSENTEAVTVKAAQAVGEDGELIQELDEIVETGDDEDGERPVPDTFESYINALFRAVQGYEKDWKAESDLDDLTDEARAALDEVVILGLQAATDGRMSVIY